MLRHCDDKSFCLIKSFCQQPDRLKTKQRTMSSIIKKLSHYSLLLYILQSRSAPYSNSELQWDSYQIQKEKIKSPFFKKKWNKPNNPRTLIKQIFARMIEPDYYTSMKYSCILSKSRKQLAFCGKNK